MMTEEEVRAAQFNWRAVADALWGAAELDGYQRGLAEGYACALDMVLRG